MLNLLIRYAIAGGTVLFLASLPLGKFEIAAKLRRVSGALFVLAFAPYLFVDLVRALPHQGSETVSARISLPSIPALELIGAFAVMTPLAYAVLAFRKRLLTPPKDAHREFARLRASGKVPVETDGHSGEASSLFDPEDEER